VTPERAPGLVGLLDADERGRLTRFRRAADRARYLAAHALVRLVLTEGRASAATLRFDRSCRCGEAHGKPVLPGGPGFSLTHAGALVGVAVWPHGAVGLDVEQVRDVADLASLATHVHSPAELARGGDTDRAAFFRTWTRKEALLKATGDGLATPMSAITIGADGAVERWAADGRAVEGRAVEGRAVEGRAAKGWAAPPGPLWLHDLSPAPDHPAAVAGTGPRPVVVEADGDAVLRG
jgi:4'-phosphopantetheinyl transferase